MISNKDIKFSVSFKNQNDQEERNNITIFDSDGTGKRIGINQTKTINILLNEVLDFQINSKKHMGLKGSIRVNIDYNGKIYLTNTTETPTFLDFDYDKDSSTINLIVTDRRINLNKKENNSFFTFKKPRNDRKENSIMVAQRKSIEFIAKKPFVVNSGDTHRNTVPPIKKEIPQKEEFDSDGKKIQKEPLYICKFSKLNWVTYDLTTLDKNGKELEKGYVTISLNEKSTFSSKIFQVDYKKTKLPSNLIINSYHHSGKGTEFIISHEPLIGIATS
ncbi:hypothetical protein ACTA71_011131 [Dictyostelium dimigraforme]